MADDTTQVHFPELTQKLTLALGNDDTPLSQGAARRLVESLEGSISPEGGLPVTDLAVVALTMSMELTMALHALELRINDLQTRI